MNRIHSRATAPHARPAASPPASHRTTEARLLTPAVPVHVSADIPVVVTLVIATTSISAPCRHL